MADSANIVDLILAKSLESLPYEEKLRIKQQGRSTPKIDLVQKIGKSNRSFQLSWYDKVSYGHHFDSGRLRSELQVLYSDQDLQSNRGKLCDYLVFLKDMELDSAMPQLYKLFSLVATIGATSAGVERSFSCLKRLKSYTRNTMGQGRLSSLALLAIERTLVKSLEKMPSWYDRVTEHFLEKERRAEFTYK